MNTISRDELPNRAFQLAFFLHREREIALQIATRALNKVQLAATAQGKRLYYRLTGRADARKARSKVSLGEPHLLQRLVYVESEEFERQRELAAQDSQTDGGVTPARHSDLVVYFIKHLVRITTRRNSFYVTLGLSRLLYNYTTPETMELYNLVIQDPDRVHDDYYYRSRKGLLLKELKERFGELLEISKGARGEQRWRPDDQGQRHASLVRECLMWFTPWATPCVVPERFDPFSDALDQLNFQGRHPDEEHEVEVNRIHATLHPDCFARLVAAHRLPMPDERLELPHFALVDDTDDSNGNSRIASQLSVEELQTINDLLAREAGRRKAASSGFFRVLVDGKQVAETGPGNNGTARFEVNENAELIEVYSADASGPLLMATHVLNFNGLKRQNFTITTEGGQEISFAVETLRDENRAPTAAGVQVTLETNTARQLTASAQRWWASLFSFAGISPAQSFGWRKPAAALAVLMLLIAGAWYVRMNRQTRNEVVSVSPTPVPSGPAVSPEDKPKEQKTPDTALNQKSPDGKPLLAPRTTSPPTDETFVARTLLQNDQNIETGEAETRGSLDPELRGKALSKVQRVHAQVAASDRRQAFLSELEMSFRNSGLQLAGAEQADAALKISVRPASSRPDDARVLVTVRAVDANGTVVWPTTRRPSSWRYIGRPRYVAERLVADLAKDIEAAKR